MGFPQNGDKMHVCGCTGTTVNVNVLHQHARTCWSQVTTLCRFQCGMTELCALLSAVLLLLRLSLRPSSAAAARLRSTSCSSAYSSIALYQAGHGHSRNILKDLSSASRYIALTTLSVALVLCIQRQPYITMKIIPSRCELTC